MSGYKGQKPGALQVVKLSQQPGRRYELDEEALASVLLRPEVRNLPVVVVSVAGAYRGGKSFILDFFLRYLNAPRSSQLSGEWLGREDEFLEGFDWRGGGDSHTKGIHIWQEPIIATIESTGEKVAVLLMDTQGTFDTETDMGDNSTIFALSTLLSSVQIYNIRANIGEDDLQHLQLFTEYGKLASDAVGKAFQTLLFLVRDWISPFEHPFGYSGGDAHLNKKLTPKSNQKRQLREVREHIHSCFENLQCFLMPHPGLVVAEEHFRGCISDISEKFRMALLELIPSLFGSNNLTPKIINGDKVQAQGFLEYFKQYVNIFNSDDLPEASTIFQATADACMMSALREAHERYESLMGNNIVEDQSVSTSILQNWHRDAIAAAVQHFKNKKKLGSQENIDTNLNNLQKELEARLSLYMWHNDAKVRDSVSLAKKAYDECLKGVCEEVSRLCLHSRDLAALHDKGLKKALTLFAQSRTRVSQDQDEERHSLIQDLQAQYQYLCTVNEQSNRNAKLNAREVYLTRMKEEVGQAGVSTEVLNGKHEKIMKAAIKQFHSHRNFVTEQAVDPDVEQLKEELEVYYADFEKSNLNSNMWALQVAEYTYNNCVSSAWGPQSCCFHPEGLKALHNTAKSRALEQFLNDREVSTEDEFKDKLIANLATRYEELKRINVFNNNQAVEIAFGEYTRRMDKHSQPALGSILIAPFILKVFALLPRYHESAKRKALSMFEEKRRGSNYDEDEYLSRLKSQISQAFDDYKDPIQAIIRELGLQNLIQS